MVLAGERGFELWSGTPRSAKAFEPIKNVGRVSEAVIQTLQVMDCQNPLFCGHARLEAEIGHKRIDVTVIAVGVCQDCGDDSGCIVVIQLWGCFCIGVHLFGPSGSTGWTLYGVNP